MPVARMRFRARGERGAVGANLTIFLAFALYAVVQLTRTTLAAQQIDDRVDSIIVTTPAIAASLTNVPKLDETGRIAEEINVAAQNLTGSLDQVVTAAGNIDNTVVGINESAAAINGSVLSIGGRVDGIFSDVRGIDGSVEGIDGETRTIRQGVADINTRASRVIGQANTINGDLNNVLAQVGGVGADGIGGNTILGHANSICNGLRNLDVLGGGPLAPVTDLLGSLGVGALATGGAGCP